MLLTNHHFVATLDGVIFSAGDSLSAIGGVQVLNKWGIYPVAISGLLTASPLLMQEVKENTSVPVFTIEELAFGNSATGLFLQRRLLKIN